jgi:hypothetical protein
MIVGGEPGGDEIQTGESRTILPREKGTDRVLGEKVIGLEGAEV